MSKTFQKLGRYILVDEIAKGGMATVYRGKLVGVAGFEKDVAIKRILPYWSDQDEFINMLIDEAKTLVHLHHHNIVQVIELAKEDDNYFIVMEFINGLDLRKLIKSLQEQKKTLPLPLACLIIKEVLQGLEFAHTRKSTNNKPLQIVHRDISPQNILISYSGQVKITDFGIAKIIGKNTETAAGVLKGKFSYMSPEQARGQSVDRKTDLFALGSVFYELIFGQKAFDGENDFETIEQVKNVNYHYPSDIDDDLKNILHLALHGDPQKRFQSAGEFLQAIKAYEQKNNFEAQSEDLHHYLNEHFHKSVENARVRTNEITQHTKVFLKTNQTRNTAQTIIHNHPALEQEAPTLIETKILPRPTQLSFSKSVTQGLSKTITEKRILAIGGFICCLIMILLWQITNSTPNPQPAPRSTQTSQTLQTTTPDRIPQRTRQSLQLKNTSKALERTLTTPQFYLVKLTAKNPKAWVHAQAKNRDHSKQKELLLTGIIDKAFSIKADFSLEEHHKQEFEIQVTPKNWYQEKHMQLAEIPKTQIKLSIRPFGEVSIDNGQTYFSSPHLFSVPPGEHIVRMKKNFGSKKLVKSLWVQNSLHQDCVGDFSNFNARLLCKPLKIETTTSPGTSPAPSN